MNKIILSAVISMMFGSAALAEEPYCREYTQTFEVNGSKQKGYGTACLQPDGSWQIVSQKSEPGNAMPEVSGQPVQYVVKQEKIYVTPTPVFVDHNLPWVNGPAYGAVVVLGGNDRRRHHSNHHHSPRW